MATLPLPPKLSGVTTFRGGGNTWHKIRILPVNLAGVAIMHAANNRVATTVLQF